MPQAFRDYFGNWVHHVNVLPPHRSLRIEAASIVLLHEPTPPAVTGVSLAEVDRRREALLEEHYDYLVPSVYVPDCVASHELAQTATEAGATGAADFAHAATALVKARFRYAPGATHVHSSLTDVLETGAGVCQDFAHLLLGVARARGLPARYVSGYLVPPEDRRAATAMEAVSGGVASHAWAEVFVAGAGWLGFDPTLGGPVGPHHVRLAYGRDYADVAPVRGVHRGQTGQRLSVDVRVRPVLDDEGTERRGSGAIVDAAAAAAQQQQ